MKLNAGKRILMFLFWLLSLLVCIAFAVHLLWPAFTDGIYGILTGALGYMQVNILGLVLLAVYLALAAFQGSLIFQSGKRSERGFIVVDSSESGRVRIAVSAIEQMVRQSVHSIDGIADMKISIESREDAIAIGVVASIFSGSHVPTITMNMQRAIRQFVEMNCGVGVCSVQISINAVATPGEVSHRRKFGRHDHETALPVQEATAAAVKEESFHAEAGTAVLPVGSAMDSCQEAVAFEEADRTSEPEYSSETPVVEEESQAVAEDEKEPENNG